jgi:Ca-activated chloride channel family protein
MKKLTTLLPAVLIAICPPLTHSNPGGTAAEQTTAVQPSPVRIVFSTHNSMGDARTALVQLRESHGIHPAQVVELDGRWLVISSWDHPSKERAKEWIARRGGLPDTLTFIVLPQSLGFPVGERRGAPNQPQRAMVGGSPTSSAAPAGSGPSPQAIGRPAPGDQHTHVNAFTLPTSSSATESASRAPFVYEPAAGTVSQGDLWRVKNGEANPSLPALNIVGEFDPNDAETERYQALGDNRFHDAKAQPLSTFSVDVDTASYSNLRRMMQRGVLPPKEAVRIEEMVNYFSYNYPAPAAGEPFSITTEVAQCPWNLDHRLVRIGLKSRDVTIENRAPANLVFLIDVSGSMAPANRLPLVKRCLTMLTEQLDARDTITMVVYAGSSGMALPPTSGAYKHEVLAALNNLQAGGSTHGAAGIMLAYEAARENFIEGGINRVFLCTDGDFNVGVTSDGGLVGLVEQESKSGVFLSVLGFGMGNYNDSMLEQISNKGNGNYAYIDNAEEGHRVLVRQGMGTLMTVARDVKIQAEFNPAKVASYRLIGYENRMLAAEDFNDDRKDAGEVGAGHSLTALYEVVPVGLQSEDTPPPVDPLRYSTIEQVGPMDELLTVKLRYKPLVGEDSILKELPVKDRVTALEVCSEDFIWAAMVANFGLILRDSVSKGVSSMETVLELAPEGIGSDPHGDRAELLELMRRYNDLTANR